MMTIFIFGWTISLMIINLKQIHISTKIIVYIIFDLWYCTFNTQYLLNMNKHTLQTQAQHWGVYMYLHRCLVAVLRQTPSWSSAPSSLRSDSGWASSGHGSATDHRDHRPGSRPRKETVKSDLQQEVEATNRRKGEKEESHRKGDERERKPEERNWLVDKKNDKRPKKTKNT